jgi:hypothetical protein
VRFSPRAIRSAAELLLERAALISATLEGLVADTATR